MPVQIVAACHFSVHRIEEYKLVARLIGDGQQAIQSETGSWALRPWIGFWPCVMEGEFVRPAPFAGSLGMGKLMPLPPASGPKRAMPAAFPNQDWTSTQWHKDKHEQGIHRQPAVASAQPELIH